MTNSYGNSEYADLSCLFFFVANYETVDADLLDIFSPKKSSHYKAFLTNYHDTVVNVNSPSEEEADGYLQSLDQQLIEKIENLYHQDFLYFGYPTLQQQKPV